jgi:hypothetical protein
VASTGNYSGSGINHEQQPFNSKLKLEVGIAGKSLTLAASATGENGEVYHEENSFVGRDLAGTLQMWVASNNHPAIVAHAFHRLEQKEGEPCLVFRFGDPEVRMSFREEIHLTVHADGNLSHQYHWGMPDGEFAPRSGSRMIKLVHSWQTTSILWPSGSSTKAP